jgi:hypothetical protein
VLQKVRKRARFFERMHVLPLQVLHSHRKLRFGIGQCDNPYRHLLQACNLRGTKSTRPRDDLEALRLQFPDEQGRKHPLCTDALRQLF